MISLNTEIDEIVLVVKSQIICASDHDSLNTEIDEIVLIVES
jgi:hypothetical protein